jgi:signal transduction histidine kinase
MWTRFSLRSRISLILAVLVLTSLAGGLVTLWYVYRIGGILTSMFDTDVMALDAAQELETALLMQKGLLTYYFLDGDPNWVKQLYQARQTFVEWLKRARERTYTESEIKTLNRIEAEYEQYTHVRDQVIKLYENGDREAGALLHRQVRSQFYSLLELCHDFKRVHEQNIEEARTKIRAQARFINILALIAMPNALGLGLLLAYILFKQILGPIRQMAMGAEASEAQEFSYSGNEVKALSKRVHHLIEDVDQTKTKLEQSREHLMQSEKWAMVGKLAAGVAHSVRNPLTSVKMRLFSMERGLHLSDMQKEDFEVISEEIRHIDNIVRNFLEYSRPPKLKMQKISPSDVVDLTLQLLHHRLEPYGVAVEVRRPSGVPLPEILADPDQLKEVMVNLMVNACEAIGIGGSILIQEEEGPDETLGRTVTIRVSDNGPGIPNSIRDKIFQPFFTTKEEGTGLGLSIAARIVEEHGGWLSLESTGNNGASFIITLPFQEGHLGQDPDRG